MSESTAPHDKDYQRIVNITEKFGRKIVAHDAIGTPDLLNLHKLVEIVAKETGIPIEEFVCRIITGRRNFREHLVIFPDPLDFFLIVCKYGGKYLIYSLNGDERFTKEEISDYRIRYLLAAYALKLSNLSNYRSNF